MTVIRRRQRRRRGCLRTTLRRRRCRPNSLLGKNGPQPRSLLKKSEKHPNPSFRRNRLCENSCLVVACGKFWPIVDADTKAGGYYQARTSRFRSYSVKFFLLSRVFTQPGKPESSILMISLLLIWTPACAGVTKPFSASC